MPVCSISDLVSPELVVSNGEIVIVLQAVGVLQGESVEVKYTGHFAGGQSVSYKTSTAEFMAAVGGHEHCGC